MGKLRVARELIETALERSRRAVRAGAARSIGESGGVVEVGKLPIVQSQLAGRKIKEIKRVGREIRVIPEIGAPVIIRPTPDLASSLPEANRRFIQRRFSEARAAGSKDAIGEAIGQAKFVEKQGVLGRAGEVTRRGFEDLPLSSALGTVGAGLFLGNTVAESAVDAFSEPTVNDVIEQQAQVTQASIGPAMRAERLSRDMAANTARLAALSPELYQQLLYGRRFPRGAIVLGGRKQEDIIGLVARGMAEGDFDPESTIDSILSGS